MPLHTVAWHTSPHHMKAHYKNHAEPNRAVPYLAVPCRSELFVFHNTEPSECRAEITQTDQSARAFDCLAKNVLVNVLRK